MLRSTRGPASRERSLAVRRSRLIPARVGASSPATGPSAAPVERLVTCVRGLRLRDREFCLWSLAIRMLRILAGQDRAAFTRIGRCDGRADHSVILWGDGEVGRIGLSTNVTATDRGAAQQSRYDLRSRPAGVVTAGRALSHERIRRGPAGRTIATPGAHSSQLATPARPDDRISPRQRRKLLDPHGNDHIPRPRRDARCDGDRSSPTFADSAIDHGAAISLAVATLPLADRPSHREHGPDCRCSADGLLLAVRRSAQDQQAHGAVALVDERAPPLAVAVLLVWTRTGTVAPPRPRFCARGERQSRTGDWSPARLLMRNDSSTPSGRGRG
jgi:hypothetical protein